MSIPFDKDDKTGDSPRADEQVRVFIAHCEEKDSQSSGKPMIVLSCVVMDGQAGEGYECNYYLASGKMFNLNCKRIMQAVGIDIDAVDVVDAGTFRGFDAPVMFKEDTYNGRTKMIIDKWVPRSEATIPLAPDPAKGVADVQAPSEPADDEDVCPF